MAQGVASRKCIVGRCLAELLEVRSEAVADLEASSVFSACLRVVREHVSGDHGTPSGSPLSSAFLESRSCSPVPPLVLVSCTASSMCRLHRLDARAGLTARGSSAGLT
jgi:hypothetical protein